MSMRYEAAILSATYSPLKVPDAPTIGTATGGSGQLSVSFTAPSNVGGSSITSYRVYVTNSSTGVITTNTGASSPIVVTGLTNGTVHTARVTAINSSGEGPQSAESNSATPIVQGQFAYTVAGTYSWVAPAEVTSVSVVAVGGGGGGMWYSGKSGGSGQYGAGGGGGGLRYQNTLAVTPGNSYTVVVGAGGTPGTTSTVTAGGNSSFGTLIANGGAKGSTAQQIAGGGGTTIGGSVGGGDGGQGAYADAGGGAYGGGGGAGGYSGNGGRATYGSGGNVIGSMTDGSGGGGGGGFSSGGGVGLLGQGANGVADFSGGGGGSGGTSGFPYAPNTGTASNGGVYGGGAGCMDNSSTFPGGTGGVGAVRIIWPGTSRTFPSTNTANV